MDEALLKYLAKNRTNHGACHPADDRKNRKAEEISCAEFMLLAYRNTEDLICNSVCQKDPQKRCHGLVL